ncbi:CPBP family intramembrane metalloprotease [Amycolatopsis acidiphila]|uniref:CPBP family intramembrane metalloprotease n=1 Tax=Amycolatopsis acidiphila TaxID=715473 RepID=A0A558AHW1_9PSEU|nr:type II CAAX endopeptidase family protein [Amycolatopsis acidiphila]TVT23829.1 CPBP family intramembrane metalloprotease [Amycolatopsis acidiphila]UIJ61194.1 CPBP family intramembrane metalloprotease [Amycolatopsis acidiphila]GHG97912.1 CAAX amino protease [Amycolatopsis acidiphila]
MTINSQAIAAGRLVRRTGLRGSVGRRPLTWFFSLSFLLSWVAWLPYVLSEDGLGVLHFGFPVILGTTQLLGVLPGAYLGPILSAFVVTAAADGRTGLRQWTGRLAKWKVSWRWYLGVLISVPAVLTLTTVAVAGQNPITPSGAVMVAYLPGLILQLLTTGIAEEPGWRDFALPRLQSRFGPLRGTLILGPLWGAWHLPLFLTQWGGPHVTPEMPLEFIGTCIAFSIVMTWVFNRTGESLPLAMLLHTSVNTFFSVAFSQMFPTLDQTDTIHAFLIGATAVALILLVATRGRLGYRRHVEVSSQPD